MQQVIDRWKGQLEQTRFSLDLAQELKKLPPIELAQFMQELDNSDLVRALSYFDSEEQGLLFSQFTISRQLDFYRSFSAKRFASLFNHMPSEDRTDLFQQLTKEEQQELLPFLEPLVRQDVLNLAAYPAESAGGIMSTDFATLNLHMSVESALMKLRKDADSKKMMYHVYVVDPYKNLVGYLSLKDLILSKPSETLDQIIKSPAPSALVTEDREEVARKIEKYDLVALPIVNAQGQLLGIVTYDEAIDVIREEHTEDMEKFMGIHSEQESLPYLETNVWQHFRARVVWVVSLAAVGIVSGMIIHRYEATLESLIILALYMPMLADTGGNAGSQSATVIVRALALGQIKPLHWMKVIFKEFRISFFIACCLGLLAYGKVLYLSWETEVPEMYSLWQIAGVISFALSLQVITATCIGASLPLMVRKFGGDPAVAASPAITTIVDITGLLIYFGCAVWLLGLQ
ncbi:MAG: magnesium transporter [Cyclobacteriaceae bacterium]|nr:magnesium transporter [Cyclobacteriaceae bacterium]MCH8516556.1 magnesium transporter [Cyclobacteriaceae bacterium]